MIMLQLTLTDYGPYAGEHTFDLATTPDKPIILVGGHNGGGKTTLFESVPLCLYGRRYSGLGRKAYEERLRRLVHRYGDHAMEPAMRRTSVRLTIQTNVEGELAEYRIRRSWGASKGHVSEELDVRKRSGDDTYDVLDSAEPDQWQAFVNGLIPPGIADLFFFDGEKVAQMAERDKERLAIRAAFNSLLGLEIVERLRRDLKVNLKRRLTADDGHIRAELDKLDTEKERAERAATSAAKARANRVSELDRIRARIRAAEERIEGLGGGYAEKRQTNRERLASKEAEAEALSRSITSLCGMELPFGLIPEQLDEVRRQMDSDVAEARRADQNKVVAGILDDVRTVMGKRGVRGEAAGAVLDAVRGFMPPDGSGPEVLGFSAVQRQRVRGVLERALGATRDEAAAASERYAAARREMERLQSMLDSAPADDEIGPLVTRVKELHADKGRFEAEIEHLDTEAARQEALVRHSNARMRDKLKSLYKSKQNERMAGLTRAVLATLEEYARRLRMKKISLLEGYVAEAARTLLHKRNFVGGVSIDTETFEATVYDTERSVIPRETLSQGELQMVATSVLWGLARASGRPLPFMIDTPLARLDARHRSNLTERFFPMASHQTLLFSTDTEIRPEDSGIRRYVSRAYTLRHDPDSAGTAVRDGYFSGGGDNEVR